MRNKCHLKKSKHKRHKKAYSNTLFFSLRLLYLVLIISGLNPSLFCTFSETIWATHGTQQAKH